MTAAIENLLCRSWAGFGGFLFPRCGFSHPKAHFCEAKAIHITSSSNNFRLFAMSCKNGYRSGFRIGNGGQGNS
jgi:hypothetical protein